MSTLVTVVPSSAGSAKLVTQEFAVDLDIVGLKITDKDLLAGLDAQWFDDGSTFGFEVPRSALVGLTDFMGAFTAAFTDEEGQRCVGVFVAF